LLGGSRQPLTVVGAILAILDEQGLRENTLVMFLSDNGSSFPFSKSNAYLNSTKTPWIVRWYQGQNSAPSRSICQAVRK